MNKFTLNVDQHQKLRPRWKEKGKLHLAIVFDFQLWNRSRAAEVEAPIRKNNHSLAQIEI